jgi:nicotinamide riboside kinase
MVWPSAIRCGPLGLDAGGEPEGYPSRCGANRGPPAAGRDNIVGMHRRIALIGSFSTGKTTLGELLAQHLELPLLPETARQVIDLGFKLDKDATPETETLIFLKQYNNELSTDEFVGDRSLIDVMAYAGWVLDNQPRSKETALWDECVKLAERRLRGNYSHVFYLPIEFPIVLDGLRPDDPAFQAEIDERLLRLLRSHDIDYITIKGSVEERMEQITQHLKG